MFLTPQEYGWHRQRSDFMLNFTTKAETLKALIPYVKTAEILPLLIFSAGEYRENNSLPIKLIRDGNMENIPLIVRSSAKNEDTSESSNAGKFLSIANLKGESQINEAVKQVADSMGSDLENNIFIQPYLSSISMSGVVFTLDPNTGGNYFVINYDDETGSSCSVTDGTGRNLKTFYCFKYSDAEIPDELSRVISLCRELENIFECNALDIEFAFSEGRLYLLQVRKLVLRCNAADPDEQRKNLGQICEKIKHSMLPHPDLHGKSTVYGVMPDWNPAEMIGIRPRTLALSLYKEIITNGVWAYQRDNYGYRNLRSFPLMQDFCGFPYVDTRVSFNSFLPKELDGELCEKLTEYYLEKLRRCPEKHDKIEFEIAYTCYTFDLPKRLEELKEHGFCDEELKTFTDALRRLTNSIICKDSRLFRTDFEKIEILQKKHAQIINSNLETADKIYWLLEYCKRYGTLPFAGLARAGFIAVELLRSMVSEGVISEGERISYMNSLSTVGKMISNDFSELSEKAFMKKYGHLRPGTYDICSPRYDMSGTTYFDFSSERTVTNEVESFKLSILQFSELQKMLDEHGLSLDVLSLFDFIKKAVEGREYAKYVFTHTLSDVLELIAKLGEKYGFTRDDMSYVSVQDIISMYTESSDVRQALTSSVERGRNLEKISASITLPPLIFNHEHIYAFFQPDGEPNFITQKSCEADTVCLPSEHELTGKIVLIKSADPGYDWLFSRNIAGFITAYGGANSHMAIRSAEFGLPAVIGVGEKGFEKYSKAKRLQIDCLNKKVTVLL